MVAALYNYIWGFLSMSWLTGPIFDKELRVSSRRRRNYVLRFIYLFVLTLFIVLIWLQEVTYSGSSLYRISRMASAGQNIVILIVWFQFCATQIIAVTILSTSISDEIYKKTLGLLMTTPINSFQIVLGKLFSKLLQLILLIGISLPLLAVVRIFGGVPWNYVISSLCITICAIIFVGSLSLFFSIFNRRAYVVMIMTTMIISVVFGLIPILAAMIWNTLELKTIISEKTLAAVLCGPNPYCIMFINTMMAFQPRGGLTGISAYYWQINCSIMLLGSALILFMSMGLVRKVALRQATGQIDVTSGRRRSRKKSVKTEPDSGKPAENVQRVKGPAVIWKEMKVPVLGRRKVTSIIALFLLIILLLISYWFFDREGMLDESETHMFYTVVYLILGISSTIIIPATTVTTEKESRSWPLLLATTLSDWDILFGKFVGSLRRCLPVWLLLFGHIIIFTFAGYIHPAAIFQMSILVMWIVIFLFCSGLYFSSRFKHTTTAVIMNFVLAVTIWIILPMIFALIAEITHNGEELVKAYMDSNPVVQAVVIMEATSDKGRLDTYHWIGFDRMDFMSSTIWFVVYMLLYSTVGLFFIFRAKRHLRCKIF